MRIGRGAALALARDGRHGRGPALGAVDGGADAEIFDVSEAGDLADVCARAAGGFDTVRRVLDDQRLFRRDTMRAIALA